MRKEIEQSKGRHIFEITTDYWYPIPCIQIMGVHDFYISFLVFSYRYMRINYGNPLYKK